jgi:hypothetical protein
MMTNKMTAFYHITCCSLNKRCSVRPGDGARGATLGYPLFIPGPRCGYEKRYADPSGIPPNIAASSIIASSCSMFDKPPHLIRNQKKEMKKDRS